MAALLVRLFHLMLVRPLVLALLRPRVLNADRLPRRGPAILVANHNSHLDTLVLMSLFPLPLVDRLRPVAASDYYLRGRLRAWLSTRLFRIVPVRRSGFRVSDGHPLGGCSEALDRDDILIMFPEGTRGEPERLAPLKPGIAHLVRRHPDVPVVPVVLRGVGTALPKGRIVPRPASCRVAVGKAVEWNGRRNPFMASLEAAMAEVARSADRPLRASPAARTTAGLRRSIGILDAARLIRRRSAGPSWARSPSLVPRAG